MFSKVAIVSVLASGAFANVFITSPTESIGMTGGKTATISWVDKGGVPSLASFGDARIGIYTGNSKQQTLLQTVADKVNVATTASVQFTPDPKIGPNGNNYFIRFDSLNLKDSASPQYPALSFSSRFTMSGMTGTFNASVQAQIDGQSTAPIVGPTPSADSSAASTAASSASHTASTTGTPSPSGTKTNSTSSASATAKNSATTTVASRFVIGLAVAVAVSYIL